MIGEVQNRITGHGDEAPDQLLANPLNFRRHPSHQMDALRGSIRELGWVKTVLVNKRTGYVIDGHARVEEAVRQKLATVPVTYVDLSPEEERLALAVLDPITEIAIRDQDALSALLADVTAEDAGLQAFLATLGQEPEATILPGADLDEVGEPPADPVTQPGDLIVLGRHRMLCGDSTKIEDVHRVMDGELAHMCWTDPPYGVSYVGKTKDAMTIQNDGGDNLAELLTGAFAGVTEALGEGAAIYVAHPAGARSVEFGVAFIAAGWRLHQTLVWLKDSMVLGHSDYHYKHEPILFGYKPGGGRRGRGGDGWFGDNSQTSVLEFARPKSSQEHPTMKPVDLVAYCIANSCPAAGTVYEPFGGSGTTMLAAESTGRSSRLIEIDPRYCDVIVNRWEKVTGQKAQRPEAHEELE